jgi:hypothetical protein
MQKGLKEEEKSEFAALASKEAGEVLDRVIRDTGVIVWNRLPSDDG